MKRRLLQAVLILAIAVAAISIAACESELPGNAVAQVGDVYITGDEFDRIVEMETSAMGVTKESYGDYYDEFLEDIRRSVLDQMVANEVISKAAVELGLSVSDEEVQTELDNYVDSYYEGDVAAMEAEAVAAGITLEEFKQNIRDGLLREQVWEKIVADVVISEEEIADYYEDHQEDYYIEPSRQARQVLVKPGEEGSTGSLISPNATAEITEADWQQALETAQEVRRSLVAGADWDEIAATYSDDFATKDSGGDLGTVYKGQTVKELEDVAFELGLDEISQPVKTVYGYHIIQVTAITTGGTQPLEEIRDSIESTLLSEAQQAAFDEWLEGKKSEFGVIYRSDLRPATTTTSSATD